MHQVASGRGYYRCRAAQHGNGVCPAPTNVPAQPLEDLALTEFEKRYINESVDAIEIESDVTAAKGRVDRTVTKMSTLLDKLDGATSGLERQMLNSKYADAQGELADAERDLAIANARANRPNIPRGLTADGLRNLPVPEQRRLLSEAFAAVVVRPARTWREPVESRTGFLGRNEAPANPTALIAHVAALNW